MNQYTLLKLLGAAFGLGFGCACIYAASLVNTVFKSNIFLLLGLGGVLFGMIAYNYGKVMLKKEKLASSLTQESKGKE